jgi:hypothetical protein
MELILNLGWLLLAAACFHFWWPRKRSGGRGNRAAQCLLALGCALVVLFPVISVTDDLHEEQAVMEDSSAKLNKRWAGSHVFAGQDFSAPPSAYSSALPDLARATGWVLPVESPSPLLGAVLPFSERAPPFSRL